MERLTYRVTHKGTETEHTNLAYSDYSTREIIERLAYYEDLMDNKSLIEVNVKIGDKAAVIDEDFSNDDHRAKVYDGIWTRVNYVQMPNGSYDIRGEVSYDVYDYFYNDGRTMKHAMYVGQMTTRIGEIVFIGENAREQAEEKLKEVNVLGYREFLAATVYKNK